MDTSAIREKHEACIASKETGSAGELLAKLAYARFLAEIGASDASEGGAARLYEEALQGYDSLLESEDGKGRGRLRRELSSAHGWYASYLESVKQFDDAETHYRSSIDIASSALPAGSCKGDVLAMGNYAMFLHKVRRDKVGALRQFLAATNAYPSHSAILVKFASFKKYCGDLDGAEELFKKAVEVASKLPGEQQGDALGAFAVFLHAVRQDVSRARDMYERAAAADPSHANNLSNFGLFLCDVAHEPASAEAMYEAALEAEPDHANAAYNYAVLLDSALKDVPRAEAMYRRVLECDAKHGYALYNLAVLLEEREHSSSSKEKRGQGGGVSNFDGDELASTAREETNSEVLSLYERAHLAAPKDALSAADLGRYLLTKAKDMERAEAMLEKSLDLDPHNAVGLYNMGLLMMDKKKDTRVATRLWEKLVKDVEPGHINALRRLARIAATAKDLKKADEHYLSALQAMVQNGQKGIAYSGQSRAASARGELEGLVNEVLATLSEMPGNQSQARGFADKLRRKL